MVHVTTHAIERYQERVRNVPEEEARAALDSPVINAAASFGAPFVRLPGGQRAVVVDGNVITVLPGGHYPGKMRMRS